MFLTNDPSGPAAVKKPEGAPPGPGNIPPAPTPTPVAPTPTPPAPTPTPTPQLTPDDKPPAPIPGDWASLHAALPDELKNDPSLVTINSFENLAKGFVHAQKAIGKDKFFVPDKHATKDDWTKVFGKLGQPENLEDYNIKYPEGTNEEAMKAIKETAHANGVLPWQMEAILQSFDGVSKTLLDTQNTQNELTQQEGLNALKKEYGSDFDTNIKKANIAFRELLPNETDRTAAIEEGLGSNPMMLRILANASKLMNEDQMLGAGGGEFVSMTREDALKKAANIQADPGHPYRDSSHMNHAAAQKEVRDLYKMAYPE